MLFFLWACSQAPQSPERVILLFVDTLRPDHLGLYGYGRNTSDPLDSWASDAVVFEEARTVAPWTLPSVRSLLSGRQPELYFEGETLQSTLQKQGWSTALFGANAYLSIGFGMEKGWDTHEILNLASAKTQADKALSWLETHPSKTLLLLQLMDAHLPYQEPEPYRSRYSSAEELPVIGKLARQRAGQPQSWSEAEKTYLMARYDNSIAYLHDQLARLFAVLTPKDMVLYFSDHGEEFFEHGGYEHGHTLYEELIRVPLVLKLPGLKASRITTPVSLLDITPTILQALQLPFSGVSLLEVAQGKVPPERAFGMGRILYGPQRWAVIKGNNKYITGEGVESLFNLKQDPNEQQDLLSAATQNPWQQSLSTALEDPSSKAIG
jgi:arylsulfatase A-like enzyme